MATPPQARAESGEEPTRDTSPPPPMTPPSLGRRGVLAASSASLMSAASMGVRTESTAAPGAAAPAVEMAPPVAPAVPAAAAPSGAAILADPTRNLGLAFSEAEREALGVSALLPPAVSDIEGEVARALAAVRKQTSPLGAYQQLMALKASSEPVFFALLRAHLTELLPIVYTPTIGDACLSWGTLLPRPSGLYLPISAKGRIRELVAQWPSRDVKIAVLTDGERILGLGDLGAHGMGITTGKSSVYNAVGGVPTSWMLPVAIDVGCNVDGVREDAMYLGLRRQRARGAEYDAFVRECVEALQARFGASLVVHWEDFGVRNSFRLLSEYAPRAATFNDDIQCTGAVAAAAILGATKLPGVPPLERQTFLFVGAGQASLGIAQQLITILMEAGDTREQAMAAIWILDSKGLLLDSRGDMSEEKQEYAQTAAAARAKGLAAGDKGIKLSLTEAVKAIKPTCLVGASAIPGIFDAEAMKLTWEAVKEQHGPNGRPIIMPLSNPTSKAECSAEQAYQATGGTAVVASGTAFAPVTYGDRTIASSQANNCYIFPGVGLGAVVAGATSVTDSMIAAAARACADATTEDELAKGLVLPTLDRAQEVALDVATAVVLQAQVEMTASTAGDQGVLQAALMSSPSDEAERVVKVKEALRRVVS